MKDLIITPTKRTPQILFKVKGELLIEGSSFPEDVTDFYKPVMDWLTEFKLIESLNISLTIDIDYLNTSSTRTLFRILKIINNMTFKNLSIYWVYEEGDEDMFYQGEILQSSIQRPFIFVIKELIK